MTDLELYTKAKEAYYNGESIMTDYEFDELEKKLGLENNSYVGAKHNPSYTIQHPYIMGSLSKVQVKERDGIVDWDGYWNEVKRFICKNKAHRFIVTPKFDGCSFEAYFNHGQLTISTRGDSEFGKNIEKHIARKFNTSHYHITDNCDEYTLRGEVLIKKDVFEAKYNDFVNPRSFVSGILNRDYSEDDDFQAMLDDLSIVIYDVRVKSNGVWNDCDWTSFKFDNQPTYFWITSELKNAKNFEDLYGDFERYREWCPYALDGIVIKPIDSERVNNTTEARPKDCVAVKFIPMLQETEIVDIEWSVAKNGELRPVIITNPVIMDGKTVTRASAHNYGYLIDNQIGIGAKVILSLAGDIIPFIYKITQTIQTTEDSLALPTYMTRAEGCHLYKLMSDGEVREQKFIESAVTLGIPSIGPAAAKTIYDFMVEQCKGDEFFGTPATEVPNNILLVSGADINRALGGKLGVNAAKAFNEYVKNITIAEIITSCTFDSCGQKVAEQIEKQMLFGTGNFEHLASKAYQWALNDYTDPNFCQVHKIMEYLGIDIADYKIKASEINKTNDDAIPVILTGEPNNYATKAEFLKCNPQYRNTTSWKEVQIVFTNDMNSTTGKMKKAIEKGIKIELY